MQAVSIFARRQLRQLMVETRFLVTGANGCIGSWVVHELIADNRIVITFDVSTDRRRLRLLLGDRADEVPHQVGDITDLAALGTAIDEHKITHVIHLAALQVPMVRADPPLGARINVVGTVNVFEAAARRQLAPIVYASSIAALDLDGSLQANPSTLYGVFKRTNEATAAVYYAEAGVSSIGLRPHTVYGVGRDQGMTAAPTHAMLAAAAGRAFAIPYGGVTQMQFAQDVARAFVDASLVASEGAFVHNLPGDTVTVREVVALIAEAVPGASISFADVALPLPGEVDATSFAALVPGFVTTPLDEGVRRTVEDFKHLLAEGRISPQATAVA